MRGVKNHRKDCRAITASSEVTKAVKRALNCSSSIASTAAISAAVALIHSPVLANEDFPAVFNLSELFLDQGSSGFVMNGIEALDATGFTVSSMGDINGDGFDDVSTGRINANVFGYFSDRREEVYVVFGQDQFAQSEFELSTLAMGDGSDGFVAHGGNLEAYTFTAIASAGDVNGDGIDDMLIGDYIERRSYVVFGTSGDSPPEFSLPSLADTNGVFGFVMDNSAVFSTGIEVAGLGDINGDGFDDILIAAPRANANGLSNNGSGYVVFGKGEFSASIELSILAIQNGENGFVINGANSEDRAGSRASSAGDINNDGFADILIGTGKYSPDSSDNIVYVVFGRNESFPGNFELSTLSTGTGSEGFALGGVEAGMSIVIDAAGDVNGDGIDDIVIGAPFANETGTIYVVYGRDSGFPPVVDLGGLTSGDSEHGFAVFGATTGSGFGSQISGAGDINADGFDDLIVNAPGDDVCYVLYGDSLGIPSVFGLENTGGSMGFEIQWDASDFGQVRSVNDAGDVNGDGIDDIIIGFPSFPTTSQFSSRVAVVFGRGRDSDDDGVIDLNDNCTLLANPTQWDSDQDGFGNRCDTDLNNDGIVNFIDFAQWAPFFNASTFGDVDFDGNGVVNFLDLTILAEFFLAQPGPSGPLPNN